MTLEIYLNSVNTYDLIAVLVLMFDRFFKIFLLNRIECIIISNKLSFNIHEEDIPSIIP